MTMLADGRFFRLLELACRDATRTPYPEAFADRLPALMLMLDTIREAWGGAIYVVSGYRTPEHNAALVALSEAHQVASGSFHVAGMAADLCPAEGPREVFRLHAIVLDLIERGLLPMLGGHALYPVSGWVHVDTRPRVPAGHIATWPAR